jgi:hypothetical protein
VARRGSPGGSRASPGVGVPLHGQPARRVHRRRGRVEVYARERPLRGGLRPRWPRPVDDLDHHRPDGRRHGPWDVELGAPRGRTLTAGRYLDALENHLRPPGLPGIRVAGDGRACGRVNGRFVVRRRGSPPPASFPKPPPTVAASISFRSDPGDFIGQGQAARYSNLENALFQVGRGTSGSIFVRSFGYDGSAWSVDLAAPGQRLPRPGVYEGAMRHPFEPPGAPGLAVGGNGRGCNMLSGRFAVHDARYGPQALVRSFLTRFEQHCEGAGPALRGEVRVGRPRRRVHAVLRLLPRTPSAGETLTAHLTVRGPGLSVRPVRCSARIERRRLVRIERVAGRRRVSCEWRLPLSGRGATVRGFVRVRTGGRVITRRFRARVRRGSLGADRPRRPLPAPSTSASPGQTVIFQVVCLVVGLFRLGQLVAVSSRCSSSRSAESCSAAPSRRVRRHAPCESL